MSDPLDLTPAMTLEYFLPNDPKQLTRIPRPTSIADKHTTRLHQPVACRVPCAFFKPLRLFWPNSAENAGRATWR